MTNERLRRAREIFIEARAVETAQRSAFLDEACAGDATLRKEVEGLLVDNPEPVGEEAKAGLEALTKRLDRRPPMPDPLIGRRVGDFTIKSLIASGGMGAVYVAVQEHPRRNVALKLMKAGIASRSALRRFEFESQTLGRLRHSGIAQVFEAGTHDGGSGGVPYFAMEYVPGAKTLTEYASAKQLGTRERLELFAMACDAVHHGHQKGIIHRDLKPSNILVDSSGQPKIIDFGVARSTDSDMATTTLQTDLGQLIGTLQYMSPEQCEADPMDIDTRSDVYALGVVLYELLCRRLPYDVSHAAIHEAVRIVQEESPTRPSTVSRSLRGDVETITLKALEKDREKRYRSAEALADDVRHYLRSEPIQARPPSVSYQLARFAGRHKPLVIGAAVVLAILVGGIAATSFALLRAIEAEELARTRLTRAIDAEELARTRLARAEGAEKQATRRADELEQVAEFQASQLGGIDVQLMAMRLRRHVLAEAQSAMVRTKLDEDEVAERTAQLQSLLARTNFTDVALRTLDENVFEGALVAVDEQFADQPLVQARLLQTVALTLTELGLLERATGPQTDALAIRRRVLGDEHPDTLISINNMGALLRSQGKLAEAKTYYRDVLEAGRRVLGDEHPLTLAWISNMGTQLQSEGKLAEAEQYYREALEGKRRILGDEHPDTLISILNMGALLRSQGKFARAEPYYRGALESRRRVLGDEHPRTLASINNMGALLQDWGKLAEADPYCREALEVRRRVLGDEHPDTLTSINNMGTLRHRQDKLAEAEPYCREALEGRRRVLGDEHSDTLNSISNMGFLLWSQGNLAEAEPYWREALEGRRRALGDEHPDTLTSIDNMGTTLRIQGKLAEAGPYYREALEGRRRALGDEHPATLSSIVNMGELLNAQERFTESEPLLRESLETGETVLGHDHWRVAEVRSFLGEALTGLDRFEEAETLLLEGHTGLEAALPPRRRPQKLPPSAERLVRLYERWGKPERATEWRARLAQVEDDAGG